MMIRQEDALAVLGDARKAILSDCLDGAWGRFDVSFRPFLPLCSPIGMANILRELVIQQVREKFVGVAGVYLHDHNVVGGRFLAEIDHRLLLSFKKLTQDFRTTNNPTATSVAFDKQEPGIPGMPDLPRITVGYKLTPFGTMEGIYLAFVVGDECVWHHELRSGEASIEFDFPTPSESAADRERREEKERREADAKRRLRLLGTDDESDGTAEKGDPPAGD